VSYEPERCDRVRAPAYLESSNPRNIPMYKRHGFKQLRRIQVGTSPQSVTILRRKLLNRRHRDLAGPLNYRLKRSASSEGSFITLDAIARAR
jgi:hypothetical protein